MSNFPARGQGKVFLINNIEFATAQLWVRDDTGIKSIADLKGKQISTTTGTTAHVFLDRALRSAKASTRQGRAARQPAHGRGGDVVRLRCGAGGGALGAVRRHGAAEGAERAQDAGRCLGLLPEGGDHGRLGRAQRLLRRNKPALAALIAGWAEANDAMHRQLDAAAETLQKNQYKEVPLADFKER